MDTLCVAFNFTGPPSVRYRSQWPSSKVIFGVVYPPPPLLFLLMGIDIPRFLC